MQHLSIDAVGIIGHISRMNNKGTRIALYVNKIDERGNITGREKVNVSLFNDAERTVLKNNAKIGDTLLIFNGSLSLNQNQEDNSESKIGPSVTCTWYRQVAVVAGNNHQTLISRNHTATA